MAVTWADVSALDPALRASLLASQTAILRTRSYRSRRPPGRPGPTWGSVPRRSPRDALPARPSNSRWARRGGGGRSGQAQVRQDILDGLCSTSRTRWGRNISGCFRLNVNGRLFSSLGSEEEVPRWPSERRGQDHRHRPGSRQGPVPGRRAKRTIRLWLGRGVGEEHGSHGGAGHGPRARDRNRSGSPSAPTGPPTRPPHRPRGARAARSRRAREGREAGKG